MNRTFTTVVCALCLSAATGVDVSAQEYSTPQVVVSTEKVRRDGKVFYSHFVRERQTLYSICKAYNVSIEEIYESNQALNLKTEGLKKDQIILVPVKEGAGAALGEEGRQVESSSTESLEAGKVAGGSGPGWSAPQEGRQLDEGKANEHTLYRVKWFDDLETIASKFKVSKESIININSLVSEKLKRRQLLRIPKYPEMWEGLPRPVGQTKVAETEPGEGQAGSAKEEGLEGGPGIFEGLFGKEGKHRVSLSLLLPVNASGKANESILDFYSGSLLAAKKLGSDGVDIDINVEDIHGGAVPQTSDLYSRSSFVIGPVSSPDILKAVRASRGQSWIVSPLDPKAEALADTTANLIQAPTPANAQIQDLIDWLRDDIKEGDKVILITQKGVAASKYASSVVEAVKASGLSFSSLSFSVLEGRDIFGKLSALASKHGTTRVVMASDNEAFALEVVRNLYMLTNKELKPTLYSTSRIRSFDTIDIQQLHTINLHVSLSYYVDYSSPSVREFVMEYRALFNTEPSQFAFQGYDLTSFFSSLYSKFGDSWEAGLKTFDHTGLQSGFDLRRDLDGGYTNNAVRRIVYRPDYSIEVVR